MASILAISAEGRALVSNHFFPGHDILSYKSLALIYESFYNKNMV
jgi:hypothetical protein